jgi:hypothetical protein
MRSSLGAREVDVGRAGLRFRTIACVGRRDLDGARASTCSGRNGGAREHLLALPAAAIGLFPAAGIVDAGSERFARHPLPNLPSPLPELVPDDPQFVGDLLQPLPDGVDRPLYGFDAAPGNTCSKSLSNPSAKLAQISSALFSFAFTLATARAISRLADSS